METVKHLDKVDRVDWGGVARGGPLGERFYPGRVEAPSTIRSWWDAMKRDWLCHALAAAFSLLVVVPAALVFGDRSAPFDFGHIFFKPAVVHPGDEMRLNYTVTNITKECDGIIRQEMIDAEGTVYDLGETQAIYRDNTGMKSRTFYRRKQVPLFKPGTTMPFAPGPAVYHAYPKYWCNPFQRLYPISVKPVEVGFTVTPGAPSALDN